ncbi:MAG TPA: alpha/beta hydrolase [Tepidisphaeraceae bacterium]|nr:alpha/beta hydrolase [Tepidisphaeraceae bacterium]
MPDSTTQPTSQPLYPHGAPGAIGREPKDVPTLTPYAARNPDGSAMLIFPGGGYGNLAHHEGEPVARWLASLGITSFVVHYRLGPRYRHPAMLHDAAHAVRTVRALAREWRVDNKRIGVLGFSAGGHLAATISTQFDAGDPSSPDPIAKVSSRPDLSVLCYPVITMSGVSAHTGSRQRLLGDNPPQELIDQMSAEKQVTERTPPAFIFHTADDPGVPVENALLYASALRSHKVPFELHIYEHGRHGVGLASDDPILRTWTERCAAWLATKNFGSG